MNTRTLVLFALLGMELVVSGCATAKGSADIGRHEPRPPIDQAFVTVYLSPPATCTEVGMVGAESDTSTDKGGPLHYATEELKR